MPSWPTFSPNVVDLGVAVLVLLYALAGYRRGWLLSTLELGSFVLGLLIALGFYATLGRLLVTWTSLPYSLAKPLAFLLLWLAFDLAWGLLMRSAIPNGDWHAPGRAIGRVLGAWPGAVRGILMGTVLITLASGLPFPGPIQTALSESRAASALQSRTAVLAEQFSQVFDDAVQETIGLLTVRPDSSERVRLPFTVVRPRVDEAAETRMLELLNQERSRGGLPPLRADSTLREAARRHSADMFEHGYFAHLAPDGTTPFDRMRALGARFNSAGENLALAPTVEVAHTGLMNSPGHRANILSPAFGRVGIGVVDGGLHGKMFTQNFAD